MGKNSRFWMNNKDPNAEYDKTVHAYRNKYYNLYRANYKGTGLNYRQEEYIMKEFGGKGTVAAFKIKNIDELGFAPGAMQTWDMYGLPETVNLINVYGSPVIPTASQVVDKDVVLGYIQSNKKPMNLIVDGYIERIAQVEMVINTNLQLHKMPFLINIDEADKDKAKDIMTRIINNELVLFVEGADPSMFKSVVTGAPYIIDKLCNYKKELENDLKTILGINNPGQSKIEQLQMSEVNANNAEIMDHETNYADCLEKFCDQIREVFGIDISVNVREEELEYEGEIHNYENRPGPKGDEE